MADITIEYGIWLKCFVPGTEQIGLLSLLITCFHKLLKISFERIATPYFPRTSRSLN